MKILTTDQIVALHSQLITTTGGLDGVRDRGLINSSLETVFDTYFGVEKYPTIEEKAARLCYSLVKNHAFLDGISLLVSLQCWFYWKSMGLF